MNEIERLRSKVLARIPGAEATVDRPNNPLTQWWLDVLHRGKRVTIEWRPRRGFGITARKTSYGAGSDELYTDVTSAARRTVQLLRTGQRTKQPGELSLGEMRLSRNMQQASIARTLGSSQVAVSNIERRGDIRLKTLGKYVHALGGRLEIAVRFPGKRVFLKGFGRSAEA